MPIHGEIRVIIRKVQVPGVAASPIAGAPPQRIMKDAFVQVLQQWFGVESCHTYGLFYPGQGEWKDVPIIHENEKDQAKKDES